MRGRPGTCSKSSGQQDLQTATPSTEGIFSTPSLPWKKLRFTSQVLLSQQFAFWHGRPVFGGSGARMGPTSDRKFKLHKGLCCSWHRLPSCVLFPSGVISHPRSSRAVAKSAKGKSKKQNKTRKARRRGAVSPRAGPFWVPATVWQALPVPGRRWSTFMLTDGHRCSSPESGPPRRRWTGGGRDSSYSKTAAR